MEREAASTCGYTFPSCPAGVVRASSIFPILSAILLLLGGVCVASSGFYKSKRNIILGGGILFVAAGETEKLRLSFPSNISNRRFRVNVDLLIGFCTAECSECPCGSLCLRGELTCQVFFFRAEQHYWSDRVHLGSPQRHLPKER